MSLLLPACSNFAGLATVRFFMGKEYLGQILSQKLTSTGMFEAIIVPGISLIIAGFYLKKEQPPRNALVFAAASSVVNGFLSWAIGHIPKSAPLEIWQYLFILTGQQTPIRSQYM